MKKALWLVFFAFAMSAQAATYSAAPVLIKPLPQQAQAAHISADVLTRFHYKAIPLDHAESKKIFDSYIKSLDGEKIFFTQSDIDQFAKARTTLDDAILGEDLSTPFAIFNLYKQRITERFSYAQTLVKQGFNFDTKESYQFEREKEPWTKSEDEIHELWRKRVKNDALRLKLAGKDDKSIIETLNKRYDKNLKSVTKLNSEDAFQLFMNAYATSIDPHTNYFGIRASEDFAIAMKLSLVGIGAVLEEKDEYTTIKELVPGGPAALSDKLKIGDRIIGVGQGKTAITDVQGWRLDDTVALIRGELDSVVVLDILPAEVGIDGEHKPVALIRKKISLEEKAAKKSIIEAKNGNVMRRIGVITLPEFYQDFSARDKGDKNFKSATRDVARLLEELKKDKVDSVLMDLRNNGGGSLDEAVNLTGLFIDQGPVVQQRDSKGNIKVEVDTKAGLAWDGPLGVLINRASASASEIFAAAIQDYGRGIIIGEGSFGKGTVQTVVDLDQLAKNDKPKFGELKMTIAQFFRVNGGTTQLRGVTPDITLPTLIDADSYGESSFDNALPWTQIKAADYKPAGNLKALFPKLVTSHDARVVKDHDYQYLLEDITRLNFERKKNSISLNLADRRKEREAQEARQKTRDLSSNPEKDAKDKNNKTAVLVDNSTLQDDGLQANERNLEADQALEKARKNAKDVLLNETVNILGDEVDLLKTDATASTH